MPRWVLLAVTLLAACSGSDGARGAAGSGGQAGDLSGGSSGSTGATAGGGGSTVSGGGGAGAGKAGAGAGAGAGGTRGTDGGMSLDDGGVDGAVLAPDMRCAPGTPEPDPLGVVTNCYDWLDDHGGLPNVDTAAIRNYALPSAAIAGEVSALSIQLEVAVPRGALTLEWWGTNEACGDAAELLWWGDVVDGELCAEFVPSNTYQHLLLVWRDQRKHDESLAVTAVPALTFCAGGSCGDGGHGHGLGTDPTPLDAPPGYFEVTGGTASPLRIDVSAAFGRIYLAGPDPFQPGDTAAPETGFFRMHDDQPFGDAWYCPGPGSTLTRVDDDTVDFDFQGITELGRCSTASGSGSVTITKSAAGTTTITGTVPELVATLEFGAPCPGFSPAIPVCNAAFQWSSRTQQALLSARTSNPEGRMEGSDVVYDLVDTAIIRHPPTGQYTLPQIACSSSGTMTVAADGGVVVELQNVSAWSSCPGAATSPSTLRGTLE